TCTTLNRICSLAAGMDVEMQPVLDRLDVWNGVEPNGGPLASRVADPVSSFDQVFLGHPQVAVEVIPGSESSRDRREFVGQGLRPEPSEQVRVGTIDDELKADRPWTSGGWGHGPDPAMQRGRTVGLA